MMKNLAHYLDHSQTRDQSKETLSLIQWDISGGRITKKEINVIQEFPDAREIRISGLTQDTFDYFISTYGKQFEAIYFWKCPLVPNLQAIETLTDVRYVLFFWNQRATRLWDFAKTPALKGLAVDGFSRLHDLSEISEASSLEELQFGDVVWPGFVVNTLDPLRDCCKIGRLTFRVKKITDERIEPIASLTDLEYLECPPNTFTTEQFAWLRAHLPNTVKSRVLAPYCQIENPIEWKDGSRKDTFIVGKRKPFLDSIQDKGKLERYVDKYNAMYHWYLENQSAKPEDYE